MKRKKYTKKEDQYLSENYPSGSTMKIASALGVSILSVYNRAHALGLKKTLEYKRSLVSDKFLKKAAASRYEKGHIPENKGKHMTPEVYEKVKPTMFKPDHVPHNMKYNGKPYLYTRKRKDGDVEKTWWIHKNKNRTYYITYLLKKHGIDPRGKVARLKNEFSHTRPPTIDDIELIDRAENMKLNTLHRYPKELALLIQAKGALNRQMNKLTKQSDK